jgi:hypothetical protein
VQVLKAEKGETGMKKAIAIAMALLVTGCTATGPQRQVAITEAYAAYIAQQRETPVIRVIGTEANPATLSISGTDITISTPLPPLAQMQPDDTQARAIETLGSVLRVGLGAAGAAYGLNQMRHMGNTTINHLPAPTP